MGAYDLASKQLVEKHPDDILRLVFPRERVRFLGHAPTELPAVQRLADRVLRVRKGGRERLVHFEIQTEWTRDVPERAADYRTRFRFGLKKNVTTVVLCLRPPRRRVQITDRFVEGTGSDRIEVRFRVVKVWELNFSDRMLERHPGLVPLAVLSERTTAKDLPRLQQTIDEAGLPSEDALDLRVILGVMAGLRRGFPKAMLRAILGDEMVAEHPILKEMRVEAEARGGLGVLRCQLQKLQVQLEPSVDQQLARADTDLLEEIGVELIGLTNAEAAREVVLRHLDNNDPS